MDNQIVFQLSSLQKSLQEQNKITFVGQCFWKTSKMFPAIHKQKCFASNVLQRSQMEQPVVRLSDLGSTSASKKMLPANESTSKITVPRGIRDIFVRRKRAVINRNQHACVQKA